MWIAVYDGQAVAEGETAVEAIKNAEAAGYPRQDVFVQLVEDKMRV